MMRVAKGLGAVAAILAVLLPAAAIGGGGMTSADFDRCNQQAMLAAGISGSQTPSASPSTSGTGTSGTGLSTSSPSRPDSTSATAPSGSSASGTISSGSTVSGSGPSVSSSTAAAGGGDQQLERAVQAYRDCLRR